MGTIRHTPSGRGLHDHEGYVEVEVAGEPPGGAFRWTTEWPPPETTTLYRAACECGWRGPILDTSGLDVVPTGLLEGEVAAAWEEHTQPWLEQLERTWDLVQLGDRYRELEYEIVEVVLVALGQRSSWAEIAEALGRPVEVTVERWGHLAQAVSR